MKQTLKQLKINKDDPDFIVAATELKDKSKKKVGELMLVIFFGVIGLLSLFGFLFLIPTTFEQFGEAQSFGDYTLLIISSSLIYPLLGGIAFLALGMAFYGFKEQPVWFIGLFKDRLLLKKYDDKKEAYNEKVISISDIKKCIILKTEHVNYMMIKGRANESIHYTISIHIAYEVKDEIKYIHLIRSDGFTELNEMLSFLQNRREIPIFYTYAPGEKYNYKTRKEEQLIFEFEQEPLQFNGYLEDFMEKEFLRRVNHFKALEKSAEHIKEEQK